MADDLAFAHITTVRLEKRHRRDLPPYEVHVGRIGPTGDLLEHRIERHPEGDLPEETLCPSS